MTLYKSPEASLTYYPASDTLYLSYSAEKLSGSFALAYQQALDSMQKHRVGKLLLDLKRDAPPTDAETELVLRPLASAQHFRPDQPLFIAAVVSESQYQYQIGNSLATALPPAQVEFNYFTSRREAADWLSAN